MAKNFKIADLKETSVYQVSLIDKWDGHAESRTMTGEELKSFTNAAAHLCRGKRGRKQHERIYNDESRD